MGKKKNWYKSVDAPRAASFNWNSYLKFNQIKAEVVFVPRTLDHVKNIIKAARQNNKKVRAVGAGHSFSDIMYCDDVVIRTDKMDKMLPISDNDRKKRFKEKYHKKESLNVAECQAGRSIINLSKGLEKDGKALINQGTYDGQAFWGAVSTSTHGSGIKRPPFPEMIQSFVLVDENGDARRIEPSDGITEPSGWSEPGVDQLIQDDDTFYSAVCSMGSMGIVHSVVILVRDFYWMDEWKYITTWDTFKKEYSDITKLKQLVNQWDIFDVLVSPSLAKGGEKAGVKFAGKQPCALSFHRVTDGRRKKGGRFWDSVAKLLEKVGIINGKAYPERLAILTGLKKDDSWMAKIVPVSLGKHGWNGGDLVPEAKPVVRRNKCYRLFPKGSKVFGGFAIELAFPVEKTFEMADKIMEKSRENDSNGLYHTAPLSIRFVAPAKAYLSPQYNQETVMYEVLMAKGSKGGVQALKNVEDLILQEPDARIHWGLSMNRLNSKNYDLSSMYPEYSKWLNTYKKFNQSSIFSNRFTDRLFEQE